MSRGVGVVITGLGAATDIYCSEAKVHRTEPAQQRLIESKMSIVPKLRNLGLKVYSSSKYLLSTVYGSYLVMRLRKPVPVFLP